MSPSVEKLWRTQRERGLVVLGISIDKAIDAPREYRRRKGFTFPAAMADTWVGASPPRQKKVPVMWVADRAGRIVMAETGQLFPEDIEQIARFL